MKFSKTDGLVTLTVVLLASMLLFFFWKDLNRTGSFQRENPLGTIVFRKRSATRRSPSSMNWERLKNNSTVYNQDLIRTADFSEAVLYFDDETKLDLFENTMMKLDFLEDIQLMEFRTGRISLTGGEGKTIDAGGRKVTFNQDSRVSFSRQDDEISIEVDLGTASVLDAQGKEEILSPSSEMRINTLTGESRILEHPVDLVEPAQNIRLLDISGKTSSIAFQWADSRNDKSAPLVMDLADNEDFNLTQSIPLESNSLIRSIEPGNWFWRIRQGDEILSAVSRFSLDREVFPHLIIPDNESRYSYRKIPPYVHFSWIPMKSVSSYIFEVSAEPDFVNPIIRYRTTLTSLSLSALDEGFWYWRISPVLSRQLLGEEPQYDIRTIQIIQKDEMQPLSLFYPVNATLYTLDSLANKGIILSWQSNQEALEYEVVLSKTKDFSSPLVSINTDKAYLNLNQEKAMPLAREGIYYWGVRWKDEEGNLSPWSSPRQLQGVDQEMALRLAYPPDRYNIADSLISNTRFTWKSNLSGRTQFQVSRDIDFENIVYQEDVQAETLLAKNWPVGRYFWRLRTFNADESVFMETQPRIFDVVAPLAKTQLKNPQPDQVYIFRPGDMQTLSWSPVEFADNYTLIILPEESETPVFEQAMIENPQYTLSFDDFPSGNYRIRIQGFALETPQSTRIIGYINEFSVLLHKLEFIQLLSPLDGVAFKGLTALREGIPFEWSSQDEPETSELKVYSAYALNAPLIDRLNPAGKIYIKPLPQGDYLWTVQGSTHGFDISSQIQGRFTVLPIPYLPIPEVINPVDNRIFGVDYLRDYRDILFQWQPVEGANFYSMSLYRAGEEEPLLESGLLQDTQYQLDDLSRLDKGDFIWNLTCQFRNADGQLEQTGLIGQFHFTIDLPSLENLQIESGDTYFGN